MRVGLGQRMIVAADGEPFDRLVSSRRSERVEGVEDAGVEMLLGCFEDEVVFLRPPILAVVV